MKLINSKRFKRCFILLMIAVSAFLFNFISIEALASQPADIKNHWASSDISSAASEGWAYMEGQKFSPNKPATREEVVWMLVGASKTIQSSIDLNTKADMAKFKDKPSPWAEGRMAIAIGNGLIKGYPDGTIKAKAPITRAEFAVLLSRLIDEKAPGGFLPFWDFIPDWALEGIKKAHAKGIINGYPDKSFGANKNVTKAEALVMIKRWKNIPPAADVPEPSNEFPNISNEFKDVKETFNTNIVLSDSFQLYYYENGADKDKYSTALFNIYESKSAFTLRINLKRFDEKNADIYKNTLKVFYPTSYETIYGEILQSIKTESSVDKKTYDNKDFTCDFYKDEMVVYIGK